MFCTRALSTVLTVVVLSAGNPVGQNAGATVQPRSFRSCSPSCGHRPARPDRYK